jgi:hypothetical protein
MPEVEGDKFFETSWKNYPATQRNNPEDLVQQPRVWNLNYFLLRTYYFPIILSPSFIGFCLCMILFLWKKKPIKVLIIFESHSPRIRNNIT